jgi:hypothetical protein
VAKWLRSLPPDDRFITISLVRTIAMVTVHLYGICTVLWCPSLYGYKGRSPSNGKLSDFSFYIDSQKSAHRKFKK